MGAAGINQSGGVRLGAPSRIDAGAGGEGDGRLGGRLSREDPGSDPLERLGRLQQLDPVAVTHGGRLACAQHGHAGTSGRRDLLQALGHVFGVTARADEQVQQLSLVEDRLPRLARGLERPGLRCDVIALGREDHRVREVQAVRHHRMHGRSVEYLVGAVEGGSRCPNPARDRVRFGDRRVRRRGHRAGIGEREPGDRVLGVPTGDIEVTGWDRQARLGQLAERRPRVVTRGARRRVATS